MENLATAQELGQYLKLSDSTIYKLASEGELPGFKIEDLCRFDMDDILKRIREKKKGVLSHKGENGGHVGALIHHPKGEIKKGKERKVPVPKGKEVKPDQVIPMEETNFKEY